MALQLRQLGRSELQVTPIGLGCWQFSRRNNVSGMFWPSLPQEETRAIVRASLEGGISWFDTAEVYGWGASEASLADALRAAGRKPGEVIVATKWWPSLRLAHSIEETIDERLAHLGGFGVDLHQVHHPLSFSGVRAQMEAMADLVQRGKIRAVGVSNFSARGMRAAHAALLERGLFLTSNQVSYSLLNRRIERNGTLAAARELGITIIAYSPLAQGRLTGVFHDDPGLVRRRQGFRRFLPGFRRKKILESQPLIDALREIGARHGATAAQVALSWLVHFHGDAVVAIPGATKVRHAVEAAGAMDFVLEAEELRRIDELSRRFARL
jgi:aryl-alcohol dehydrogenase-like predicted oxidoreductase